MWTASTYLSIYKHQGTAVYCSVLAVHPFRRLKHLSQLTPEILIPLVKVVVIPTFNDYLQSHSIFS